MVNVNQDKCIGCGMCANISEVFEMKDGKAHVRAGADLEKNKEKIKEAVDSCPVDAISG